MISRTDTLTDEEIASARHIFVASERLANDLAERGYPATFLPQCTDPEIFAPDRRDLSVASDLLFVGNRRPYAPRPIVEKALAAEGDVDVWGHGWDGRLPDGVWRGKSIPNPDLGRYYASADVVLNDHTSDMLRDGLVSNRVFDVLASGRPILTERMRGVPSDIAPFLTFYGEDDFEDALAQAREAGGRDRREIADHVRTDHSFARRAAEILEVVNG